MRRVAVVCASIALLLATLMVAAELTNRADLASLYYEGRSGPIVIAGPAIVRDSHAVFIDSGRLLSSPHSGSLPAASLASVLTRAASISGQPSQDRHEDAQEMSKDKESKQTKANVIFNIEAVGKTTLDRFSLPHLSNPSASHVSVSLTTPSVSPVESSVSVATTLSTGSPVSRHGIVAERWMDSKSGKSVRAFDPKLPAAESYAAVPTLADIVASTTNGKGLTLSFGSDGQLVRAFGVNKQLSESNPEWKNNLLLAVHGSDGAVRKIGEHSAPALHMRPEELIERMTMSASSLVNNLAQATTQAGATNNIIQASFVKGVLKVSFSDHGETQHATFDLSSKADRLFLTELQYVLDLPSRLTSVAALRNMLNDEAADLLVVSMSGLKYLIEAYGRESEQFVAALQMLDALFPLIHAQFASLFDAVVVPGADSQGAGLVQPIQTIVFLGSHATVLDNTDTRLIEQVLTKHKKEIGSIDFYPNLYPSTQDIMNLCYTLNQELAPLHASAFCPSVQNTLPNIATEAHRRRGRAAAPTPAAAAQQQMLVESGSHAKSKSHAHQQSKFTTQSGGDKNSGSPLGATTPPLQPTKQEIGKYQIVLWFSITISFVLLASVWVLADMSVRKDSMIYSSFNPNWERKGR